MSATEHESLRACPDGMWWLLQYAALAEATARTALPLECARWGNEAMSGTGCLPERMPAELVLYKDARPLQLALLPLLVRCAVVMSYTALASRLCISTH